MLRNILEHPTEAKYRRLRLGNKRIQETIVDVSGGIALLQVHCRQSCKQLKQLVLIWHHSEASTCKAQAKIGSRCTGLWL